ncbi:hypothetical protein BRW84_04045 [Oxalobacter formigenes OXCC13]|uniref:HTH Mu-type domain-containing protein n=2 Tax=Oxalobacter formigenes TaxID=847 RepID=C3XAJ2_OXAFO|nr:hypothetical protein [Oxalobacter formigenes]ARQ77879.1 hypothetical protein BRW84_04045 [Oxalobacter formigenes OXCC13]EEO30218.1 hypothetical protein OFBG_01246 [Oxalobacter formigenes OXCC13]QDX33578.1 hypothetical protein FPZ51_08360 [Oxalobacter formigenes]
MKILFTAAEIARMRLPGLPTTKSSILSRAAKEGWRYEEQYGIGGIRKVFEIPEHYLVLAHGETAGIAAYQNAEHYRVKRTGAENDISGSVNTAKLTAAAQVVEKWDSEEKIGMSPDKKSAIIAIFYKILMDGCETADLSHLLKELSDTLKDK